MSKLSRRRFIARASLGAALPSSWAPVAGASDESFYPSVRRGVPIVFPHDHGAHALYRTEWWYLTGWLKRLAGAHRDEPAGVQVTFFRARTRHDPADPSRFAPTQLLFAHAALALPERTRLVHAQRAARSGFGLAEASSVDTAISIGNWSLARQPDDHYRTSLADVQLALDLAFTPASAPVLQGEAGFSRKGPLVQQASYYYSRPQLRVSGRIASGSLEAPVAGIAWLDHEWSSEILDRHAEGWDWVGLNFDDGSALMAFRIRHGDAGAPWAQARWIDRQGRMPVPDPTPLFTPLRFWRSARSGARYPVSMRLQVGVRTLELEPLFDDQELDARASVGTIYWEGAVSVHEAGRRVGRGYLELTGYAGAVRF